jgi:hypothetical protein
MRSSRQKQLHYIFCQFVVAIIFYFKVFAFIAEFLVEQLEKRIVFRRAIRRNGRKYPLFILRAKVGGNTHTQCQPITIFSFTLFDGEYSEQHPLQALDPHEV